MKVTLIASTTLAGSGGSYDTFKPRAINTWMDKDVQATDADTLAEFGGRACYQSFSKPNEKTRRNKDYLANIIGQAHESVLEHASASFYVEGVSRNLLLELERHRHLSFSVISQRYVDSSTTAFVLPPAISRDDYEAETKMVDDDFEPVTIGQVIEGVLIDSVVAYEEIVSHLQAKGLKRKEAREAARAILPGGIETKFVVTGNMRAWRDVLRKRYSVHADAEIQALAAELLSQLRKIAPASFQDFPDQPFGSEENK